MRRIAFHATLVLLGSILAAACALSPNADLPSASAEKEGGGLTNGGGKGSVQDPALPTIDLSCSQEDTGGVGGVGGALNENCPN